MVFIALLFLSAFSLASCAAYFSIVGLATIFAGSFWPVIIMGGSLEVAKLITASFLYRYWKTTSKLMKGYMITAVVTLMLITSAGIFGFLSGAHQQKSLPLKQIDAKIESLKHEKADLLTRKQQIDEIIAKIPPAYITKRIELMKTFSGEENKINKRIPEITVELRELTQKELTQETETGPIVFISKVIGVDMDDTTSFMIYLIMFVFDPLAVTLTIGANMAVLKNKKVVAPVGEIIKEVEMPIPNVSDQKQPDNENDAKHPKAHDEKVKWKPRNHTF